VRDGLKVVVFEQTSEVLESGSGFRVAEYGLRQVFKRVPDHPDPGRNRDGRTSATGGARPRSSPPRLKYELSRRSQPHHRPSSGCEIRGAAGLAVRQPAATWPRC